MKRFTETYKEKTKVVTEGLSKKAKEAFKGIEGKTINECCCQQSCDTCCDGCNACSCNTYNGCACKDDTCFSVPFSSDAAIMLKLNTDVKVQDMYSIRNMMNFGQAYMPSDINDAINATPLFFFEKGFTNIESNGMLQESGPKDNKCLLGFLKGLYKKHGIGYQIVVNYINGGAKVFGVKHSGTNGAEGNIKSSLLKMYETLNSIQEMEEVSDATICDVSIDCIDDAYSFLFCITLDRVFLMQLIQ